jgi:hypothetical protein
VQAVPPLTRIGPLLIRPDRHTTTTTPTTTTTMQRRVQYSAGELVLAAGSTGAWWAADVVYHNLFTNLVHIRWRDSPTWTCTQWWPECEENPSATRTQDVRRTDASLTGDTPPSLRAAPTRGAESSEVSWDSWICAMPEWGICRPLLENEDAVGNDDDDKPELRFSEGERVIAKCYAGYWWAADVIEHDCSAKTIKLRWEADSYKKWAPTEALVYETDVCRSFPLRFFTFVVITKSNLSHFSVERDACNWVDEALKRFRDNGFVVVKGVLGRLACDDLHNTCAAIEGEIRQRSPHGNRADSRWSIGTASRTGSMLHEPSWSALLGCEPLLDVIERIFPEGGECVSGGGDFVGGETATYQTLHSDIIVPAHLDVEFPPPFVSCNFAVRPVYASNGPTRIVPGTQTLSGRAMRENFWTPRVWEEPDEWLHSTLQPLEYGDVIIRDVRTLHGGTPNCAKWSRFLPSVEFASAALRETKRTDIWPAVSCPSLPDDIFQTLSGRAQAWCGNLRAPRHRIDVGWR